jgi:hypothetical protein
MIELAQRAGYRVQQSADAFAGRKIYLHYRSVFGPHLWSVLHGACRWFVLGGVFCVN